MGLTKQSMKYNGVPSKNAKNVLGLAGNPNVGKSTVFNALTGLKQHTGNWTGKTVSTAVGEYTYRGETYRLVDLPGIYSLLASSEEERVARDYLCFSPGQGVVVVADAVCLERNLNLVLQICEVRGDVVLCVNLLDEARKKGIEIDLDELSLQLGIPVVGAAARQGDGLMELKAQTAELCAGKIRTFCPKIPYGDAVENALSRLQVRIDALGPFPLPSRWIALRLLDSDPALRGTMTREWGIDLWEDRILRKELELLDLPRLGEQIAEGRICHAARIAEQCILFHCETYNRFDRKTDNVVLSRKFGIPILIGLLLLIFWLTVQGANLPSQWLSNLFSAGGTWLSGLFSAWNAPGWLSGILLDGVYRTLTWVVAVMLPPMAIFFPLFTLLEDLGYLPRVAFIMDPLCRHAGAHGKQALTTCMGFGCNACGVIGCRIIDSPRERLIGILTNSFIPCNGRFPFLLTLITVFFAGENSFAAALLLTACILFAVSISLLASKFLSVTLLKGVPSSFSLELPPYRVPQVGQVLVRSVLDRTLFVLGRAVLSAAPAGVLIWLMANVPVGDGTLLSLCTLALDPIAAVFGLDGVILMAFLLGFPANEIVLPLMLMGYLSTGTMVEAGDLTVLSQVLTDNGWTWVTAACCIVFSVCHFPCATTCRTIYKETGSLKKTLFAMAFPTAVGLLLCFLLARLG